MDDVVFFEAPSRIRASLSKMIGANPEEIALTTGASTGVAAVAQFPEVEAGGHYCQGGISTAIRNLETYGRTPRRVADSFWLVR